MVGFLQGFPALSHWATDVSAPPALSAAGSGCVPHLFYFTAEGGCATQDQVTGYRGQGTGNREQGKLKADSFLRLQYTSRNDKTREQQQMHRSFAALQDDTGT